MLDTNTTIIKTGKFIFLLNQQTNGNISFYQESPIHRALFWVAISVLQLDDITLYAAGLALLEQNLHTLSSQGAFDKTVRLIYYFCC